MFKLPKFRDLGIETKTKGQQRSGGRLPSILVRVRHKVNEPAAREIREELSSLQA